MDSSLEGRKALAEQDIDRIFDRAAKALGVELTRPRGEASGGVTVARSAFEGGGEIMYHVLYSFAAGKARVTLSVGRPLSFSPAGQISRTFDAEGVSWEELADALAGMRRSLAGRG